MRSNWILICTLLCVTLHESKGGITKIRLGEETPQAEDRIFSPKDPIDIFTKWGPFGYFNQYADPSNQMGPEILKGFGVPFTAYNGFNLMDEITAPPLEVPAEATSTSLSTIYGDELFAPEDTGKSKPNYSKKPTDSLKSSGQSPSVPAPAPGSYAGYGYGTGGQPPMMPLPAVYPGQEAPTAQIPVHPGYAQPMPRPNPSYGYPYYAPNPYPPSYPGPGRSYYV